MTLEEWQAFCLRKLVRVIDPGGRPAFRGIVTAVGRPRSAATDDPRVSLKIAGDFLDSDSTYEEHWYIDTENRPDRWHVEVWS